jgi:predicted phage baseplate assembly protein
MALPAPNLDDRGFQQIVDEAKRLIPQYCPEWTNHNLSDPGIALIELFAWMSEMVLYRINQVPDRLYSTFLNLVGIELFPPSVAEARLTFLLSAPVDEVVRVPTGTEVTTTTVGNEEPVVFTTTEDLVITQPELVAALAGVAGEERYDDGTANLRYGNAPVTTFPSLTPGDAFHIGFDRSLAGQVLQLQITASIEGFGVDPTDPPLRWEAWSGEAWIPVVTQEDTTGGLNRAGTVVLQVPMEHEQLTLGTSRAHWVRAKLLPPIEGRPWYESSPQIQTLGVASLGGTTHAEHATRHIGELLGISDGGPGQVFNLKNVPVLSPRADGEVIEVVEDGVATPWEEVDDFSRSGPGDHHVRWDSTSGEITFGPIIRYPDGRPRQHGAIPPDGAAIRVTGYRSGGGEKANVGAGKLSALRGSIPFISRVTNLEPATGGVDGETIENAKLRGPMTLQTGQRAVTGADFERLALEASTEVARTRCLPPKSPGGPVRVLVVPHARDEPRQHRLDHFALDDALVERIRTHLDERRLLGTVVELSPPYYQGVTIAALLRSLPGRPASRIREQSTDLLYRYVNPLTGGADGRGWLFDTDINAATIAQMLEAVDGVDRVEEVLLFEYDLRTGERHGVGREQIRLEEHSLFLSANHQVVVRQ